jgi:hypothetical protein
MAIKARFKFYFKLDEELFQDEDTKEQLYRTYSEAAAVAYQPMTAEEAASGKRALMLLRGMILNHTFWLSSDPEADELWASAILPALPKAIERTVRHQKMYQRQGKKIGVLLPPFERMDLQLDPYVFSFEDTTNLTEDVVVDAVEQIRVLLNDGVFDSALLQRIDIPQVVAAEPEAEEQTAEAVAAEDDATAAGGDIADGTAPDDQAGDDADDDATAGDDAAQAGDEMADGEAADGAEEGQEAEPEPKVVDYSIWEVFYKDGTSRLFDSKGNSWIQPQ